MNQHTACRFAILIIVQCVQIHAEMMLFRTVVSDLEIVQWYSPALYSLCDWLGLTSEIVL